MTTETQNFVRGMEKAGRSAAETLQYLGRLVKPGISTNELDEAAVEFIRSKGAIAAPLRYHGFPKSICTSVNEVICHGLPGEYVLKKGDIINIDVTNIVDGYHGDTSATYYVGDVSEAARKITEAAKA